MLLCVINMDVERQEDVSDLVTRVVMSSKETSSTRSSFVSAATDSYIA